MKNREVLTVNDNMRYVMVEFPRHVMPPNYLDWMFRLTLAGFTPILTHPERNTAVNGKTDIVRKWVEKGGLVQLTAMSITGDFGPEIRKCSEELLKYKRTSMSLRPTRIRSRGARPCSQRPSRSPHLLSAPTVPAAWWKTTPRRSLPANPSTPRNPFLRSRGSSPGFSGSFEF